ncbi:MAG: plastocyanin/azurin family copper-binding protein [Gemmatimonadota bacterium]|jgi:plastocyanin
MRSQLRSLRVLLALVVLPVVTLSCGGDDNGGMVDPETTGDIRARVTTDGNNAAGVEVRLFQTGAATASETGTTGADGTVTFQDLEPGSWEVEIEVPAGTEIVGGGDDRTGVTVTAGQTSQVSFALETVVEGDVVEIVATSSFTFSPSEVTISPGTTVRWRNEATIFHTVTPDGHSEWSEASLNQAGQTFTHTFESVGEFPYFCVPHQAQGMTGTVIVQ